MSEVLDRGVDAEDLAAALIARYRRVRADTEALAQPLSIEDQTVQSMPDASPTKWHLAHTSWFWETFVLGPHWERYEPFDARFGYLFNSYYEAVGPRHARPARGMITRPALPKVRAYRRHVDAAMDAFAAAQPDGLAALVDVVELGLAHEEQHQELILTDIKHAFFQNPFEIAAYAAPDGAAAAEGPAELDWVAFEGGEVVIGADGEDFAFDNEGPRHRALLEPYALASRSATNGEFLEFIEDGGYETATLWLSDGWDDVRRRGLSAPLYWRRDEDGWSEHTLHGRVPLDPAAPVAHLTYYEAAAFAEWTDARLPEEREWEHAARGADATAGRFAAPGESAHPAAASAEEGLTQMFGDVWEWTRSAYAAYPRYRAPAGAIGEYNGKFMSGQLVLKGGSCATPRGHVRASYRNFFPPTAQWQFSGVRLARDV